jgi:hypothetical protein
MGTYQILYELEKVGTDTYENITPSSSKDATGHMQVSMCFCCLKMGAHPYKVMSTLDVLQ